nr:immunoglobulin light chain junction region [Macaca mulatta]
CGQGTHVPLTF